MKRKTRSRSLPMGNNFPLIGAVFMVLIAAAVFVYGNFWESRLDDEAFEVLTHARYEVIDDKMAYDFLMAIKPEIAESETLPHLQINTRKLHSEFNAFLRSVDESILPSSKRKELLEGIVSKTWLWDSEKLPKYNCLTPREISEIHSAWEEVVSQIENELPAELPNSFHQFSKPVFDTEGKYALIQHYNFCGPLCAKEEIVLYLNNQGTWERVKEYVLWVS